MLSIHDFVRKLATRFMGDDTPENLAEAKKLKPDILKYIKGKSSVTMDDIYTDLDCSDIPMYLALHELVKEDKIKGESPYEARLGDHKKYVYKIAAKSPAKGFFTDIEKDTIDNKNFRKVLYTGKNSQLVLMTLKSGEDIGTETHDVDQFFRIEKGTGEIIVNNTTYKVKDGSAVVIPANAEHNVINTGDEPLAIYTIYSPPHHQDKTINKTKEEALESEEHFDGKTTEESVKTASVDTTDGDKNPY